MEDGTGETVGSVSQREGGGDAVDGILIDDDIYCDEGMAGDVASSNKSGGGSPQKFWKFGSVEVDRGMIQYITIYVLIFIICITSLLNLSFRSDRGELWTSLLSMMCGIIVPQPKYKKNQSAQKEK